MKLHFLFGAALFSAALGSVLLGACGAQPDGDATPSTTEADEDVSPPEPVLAEPTHRRPLLANGLLPGMKPYRGGKQQTATPQCNNPKVSYFGGPIVMTPIIVPVFWNGNVNAALTAPTTGIAQFYADVTVSSYWPWLQEYDTVGLAGGSEQAILPGTATAGVTIAPVKCPTTTTTTCNLTDAQLQTELNRQIGLGVLPPPTLDCTNNARTIYMIEFPHNIKLTGPQGVGTSCVGYCAYHNTGTYGTNTPLIYGVLMDEFTGACATGCGTNATAMENSTDTASHELVEAITDPDIGLDTGAGYQAPAAWGDNNNGCGEVGDICDDDGTGDTITVSGRNWVVQEIWSNKQNKCTSTGTAQAVCSGTTLTNCRKCSCGDDGGACTGSTSVCETTSTNVLFGGCEQCTATSKNCTGGTCEQSTTPALDDICSGCTQLTKCPAGDNCGTISDGCGGTLTCGTCTAPQTCGGGTPSNPNVCGCTPIKSCPAGDNCGTISDGCGGTLNCGTCTAPQTCGSPINPNACSMCTPLATCPAGDNCGTISNGCGGMLSCGGACTSQTCGGGGTPNVCGCTPLASCPAGENCGTFSNGCGGTLSCGGACAAGDVRRWWHPQRLRLHAAGVLPRGRQLRHALERLRRHARLRRRMHRAADLHQQRLRLHAADGLPRRRRLRDGPRRLRRHRRLRDVRSPADLRRRLAEQPERLRLHPADGLPRRRRLREDPRRLRRHPRLRDVHGPADLRRRHPQEPEPVRLHAADPVPPRVRVRSGVGRLRRHLHVRHLRREPDVRELPVRQGHEHLLQLRQHDEQLLRFRQHVEQLRRHRRRVVQRELGLGDEQQRSGHGRRVRDGRQLVPRRHEQQLGRLCRHQQQHGPVRRREQQLRLRPHQHGVGSGLRWQRGRRRRQLERQRPVERLRVQDRG